MAVDSVLLDQSRPGFALGFKPIECLAQARRSTSGPADKEGVVDVSWHDTRDLPSSRSGWNVRFRASLMLGLASIAGVEGGVQLATALPEVWLRRLFAVLVFAVAANIAWRNRRD